MADVGNFLRKEGVQYKELGYKRLRELMEALADFTLEDRFSAPGNPPYTVVKLPQRKAAAKPAKANGQPAQPSETKEGLSAKEKEAITRKIRAQFIGQDEVFMADVGNFLLKQGVRYKALGYKKLRELMEALTAFTLEDRFSAPGNPPYTVVRMNRKQAPAARPAKQTPRLFDFAYVPMAKAAALSALCGTQVSPMEYLVDRFDAVTPTVTDKAAWFDTGMLFADDAKPIFAYFEANVHPNAQPWFFVDFREDPAQKQSRLPVRQARQEQKKQEPTKPRTERARTKAEPARAKPETLKVKAEPPKGEEKAQHAEPAKQPAARGARPRRVQPGKALEAFAYMGVWRETLETLADMALEENWDFLSGGVRGENQLLHSYLCYTFYRLQLQDKIAIAPEQDFAAFNTGLVTPSYDEIYACFEQNHSGASPWQLSGFCRAGERGLGKKLTEKFNPLPQAANYFEDLRDVLYETTLSPIVDYQHIIVDNLKRLPLSFIRNQCYDDQQALALVQAAENAAGYDQRQTALQKLSAHIEDTQVLFNRIRNRVKDAIDLAIKRVSWNYKTAIPMFYPRGNAMSLLLPLCLNDDTKADVALVVQRMSSGNYQGQTILTLAQAYLDARLVCRPDSDWLKTDSIGQAELDEQDEMDQSET